jgi:phage terminase large subunit GpA-like protein
MSYKTEYLHSPKTNSYRRRSKSLSDKADDGKNVLLHGKRYHSPPPRHAHHQPVMKFNADMWMQDFKQNVMNKLFKEERFKAFQKKRRELENLMDVSDDDEWQEQQMLIQSVVQNEWENYQSSPYSQYQNWLQEQQFLAAAQQYQQNLQQQQQQQQQIQQEQQEFINNLPAEIAQAVISKNLPPEWFQYRESTEF